MLWRNSRICWRSELESTFFFPFFLRSLGLTFTIISFHFILFHLISIKGFMCLWSHVWRRKKPTCLSCSCLSSVEPWVRAQDAGLPQVGSRRWEGAAAPGWWTHPALHLLLSSCSGGHMPPQTSGWTGAGSHGAGIANPRLAALST